MNEESFFIPISYFKTNINKTKADQPIKEDPLLS